MATTVNWSIQTEKEGAVTVLSEGRFTLPVLNGDKSSDMSRLVDGVDFDSFIILYPAMGRAQLYLQHWFVADQAMPCDVADYVNKQ